MGLKGDIDEAKVIWAGSPWWMKPLLVMSVFISISSIATLSDLIINWKGFILDAIEFYRQWINIPVSVLFGHINIHLSRLNTDFLILGMLFISSAVREMWASTELFKPNRCNRVYFWCAWGYSRIGVLVL